MFPEPRTLNTEPFSISLEYYRNPIRLELVRHVMPLVIFVFFIAMGVGYAWAMAAFRSFPR